MNACLSLGVFPEVWKEGELCIIPKGADKDKTRVRSYRPVCLLSAFGKIFERLLLGRLRKTVLGPGRISEQQFGFMKSRSAEDAICDVRRIAGERDERLVLSLLFDITGAFDNVRWPLVLRGLAVRGCPRNVLSVLEHYFSDRVMRISWNGGNVSKRATMGCPQGSVLGPCAWNIVFDDVLRILERLVGRDFVAYADDLQVIIAANTRRSLEEKAQRVANAVADWCRGAGLTLSGAKTEMVFLKFAKNPRRAARDRKLGSRLNRERANPSDWNIRAPVVRVDGTSISLKKSVRSLGVHIDEGLRAGTHCERVAAKLKTTASAIRRCAPRKWGLSYRTMKILYGGLIKPVASYAAAGWSDLTNERDRRKLRSAQRQALLTLTRAYRTASTDALCVLAGEVPISLLLAQRSAHYRLRKAQATSIGDLSIQADAIDDNTASLINEEVNSMWQREWSESPNGRITHAYFPDIRGRLKCPWISPGYHVSQFLTGHGDFAANLWRLGLSDGPGCSCGAAEESMAHVLTECMHFTEPRSKLHLALGVEVHWPSVARHLVTRTGYKAFDEFARAVILIKEDRRRELRRKADGRTD